MLDRFLSGFGASTDEQSSSDDSVSGFLDAFGTGSGSEFGSSANVSSGREADFELSTGQFRGDDGQFDVGGAPPDYDSSTRRYRGENGQFKSRSADLYDEPEEARSGVLWPEG